MDEIKQKMEQDGLTLTTEEGVRFLKGQKLSAYYLYAVTYNDIYVPAGLDTVRFPEGRYYLHEAHRQFPDVKKLVIEKDVNLLEIPNSMFPNVREVESSSSRYRSGPCLVHQNGTLYNTFCRRPGEEVNLKGVKSVVSFAFNGCMSENITNDKEVTYAAPDAFTGSLFSMAPGKLFMVGKVLVRWDKPEIEVRVPASCVLQGGGPHLAHVVLYDKESLKAFTYTRQVGYGAVIDIRDESFHMQPSAMSVDNLVANTSLYTAKEKITYTSDMRRLVSFPFDRKGHFAVPEGVTEIGQLAFQCSSLSSIAFPPSMRKVMEIAFGRSDIASVRFNDGLQMIDSGAFLDCDRLKSVRLPASLVYLGKQSLPCLDEIEVCGDMLPDGLASLLVHLEEDAPVIKGTDGSWQDWLVKLKFRGKTWHLPKYSNTDKEFLLMRLQALGEDIQDKMCLGIRNVMIKQETAICLYRGTGSKELLSYLRRASKSIIERYISSFREDLLIAFLRLGISPANTITSLLPEMQRAGMTQAAAYAMDISEGEKKGVSFRL